MLLRRLVFVLAVVWLGVAALVCTTLDDMRDAKARVDSRDSQSWACDSLPSWAKKP